MTRSEMLAGFEELGGETVENAVTLTIRKYEELPKHWEDIQMPLGESNHAPHAGNCPLCRVCCAGPPMCQDCPLAGCEEWAKADIARIEGKEPEFVAACQAIVDKLKAWQEDRA